MAMTLRGARVLVVEDEALVSMLIEDLLGDAGATVVGPAATVSEALRLVGMTTGDGIDAVVLDLNLNGEASLPVADRLMALGIPFVFATGGDTDLMGPRHRAVPILQKPFDCDELISSIAAVLLVSVGDAAPEALPAATALPALPSRAFSYIQ